MAMDLNLTPKEEGLSMPPEWAPHAATLMSWPTRLDLWGDRLDDAKREYAGVARSIADFEPVVIVCAASEVRDVRDRCGAHVETLPAPLDDSWLRDNGPTFVRNGAGQVAAVKFGFNAWGERFEPYDADDALPYRIAQHLGMPIFTAPFVLEGGAFLVDGEGTLLTTEICLLNENRNPGMTKAEIEQGLRDYLGVDTVVWLPYGMAADVGPNATDGHVDGVAQYVAPGHVLLLAPEDPADDDHAFGQENLRRLREARDAKDRAYDITRLEVDPGAALSYANCYVANGVVVVPTAGDGRDDDAIAQIAAVFPARQVVGTPGLTLNFGGGGPHCITQQVPAGDPATV
jgi:agmatine deiminase